MERKTCTHSKRFSLTFSKVRPTHFRPAFLFAFIVILFASISGAQNFAATPLIDYQPGGTYLNTFPGFLYEGSNTMPVDHDSDGLAAATHSALESSWETFSPGQDRSGRHGIFQLDLRALPQ